MNNKLGNLIVISGPSGVGKGTVVKELIKNENIKLSVSATTRKPREGENNGEAYFFITKAEFEKMIEENGFLEYARYCDNYYGTPKEAVQKNLEMGYDVILEIDVQGGENIRKAVSNSVLIFLVPPSRDVLKARLLGRGTEDEQTVEKRLLAAEKELLQAKNYDYIVESDTVENCTKNVLSIINAEHFRVKDKI